MEERNKLLLGAFLHDIGKFWQRGIDGDKKEHVEYSADFFESYLPEKWQDAAYIAYQHHEEENQIDQLTEIVKLADQLSASEREEGRGQPSKTRLSPVQNSISVPKKVDDGSTEETGRKLALRRMDFNEESLIPEKLPGKDLTHRYSELWDDFTNELSRLPDNNFDTFFANLYYLLYKYTSNVPSATWRSRPDISLFDHLRTTAAFATSLQETGMEERFIYLEGDISGVQDFIYRVSSPQTAEVKKQMANRLRGRSFFLTLLNRSIADYFLEELGLPLTNTLWSGGGHFSLILPDTSDASQIVEELSRKVNEYLFSRYEGQLSLAIGSLSVSGEILGKNFSAVKKKMANELAEAKRKKLSGLDLDRKFEVAEKVCPICDTSFSGEAQTCPNCRTHVELGQKLRNADGISKLPEEAKNEADLKFEELNQFWKIGPSENSSVEYGINEPNFLSSGRDGFFLIANRVPKEPEFKKMANHGIGASYLGVLRMDVDDLGAIFALGIPEEDRSISRFATLSRHLDVFFTGYLDRLSASYPSSYTTYAGGDDVFIVGEWSEMVELALTVRQDFGKFGCDREDFHLSAALFVTEPTYPIGRAAELAGENLDQKAKGREGKDVIHLFGQTVPWEEFLDLLGFSKRLVDLLEAEKISKNLVHTVSGLYERYIDEEGENIVWIPKLLYSLTRNVDEEKLREELKRKVQKHSEYLPVVVSYVNLATKEED